MYAIAFIFIPGEYDEEFHRLNALIESAAEALPGYKGSESWYSQSGERVNATYYWDNLDSLRAFARDPHHLEAKKQYQKWYQGYQVYISEIIRSYGDGTIKPWA